MAREREHPQPMAAVRGTLGEHEGFIIAKIQYVSQDLFLKYMYYNYSLLLSYLKNPCIFGFSSPPQTFCVLILTIKKVIIVKDLTCFSFDVSKNLALIAKKLPPSLIIRRSFSSNCRQSESIIFFV